jgi:TetR/AcrR family transcriptional regulator, mexJK operon transcriptional repressor
MSAVAEAVQKRQSPKIAQILEAATALFLSQGYGATSMDGVARSAGVSKATLYAHFAGKDDLFAAVVEAECARLKAALAPSGAAGDDLPAALRRIAGAFVDRMFSADGLAMYRTVVAEAVRFPELGRSFYDSAPAEVLSRLAAYLQGAASRGLLALENPREAAEHFIGLLRGETYLRHLLGIARPTPRELDHLVDTAVRVFLRAYGRPA